MDERRAESIIFRVEAVQRATLLTTHLNNKNIRHLTLALRIKKCYGISFISSSDINEPSYYVV